MTANYLAIIIASVIAMVLGMGWYGALFGKVWAKIIGMKDPNELTPEEKKEMNKKSMPLYVIQLVMTLIMMWVLYFYVKSWVTVSGVTASFFAWFGFVLPVQAANALWSGKPKAHAWGLFLITAGYQLICFIIAGALYQVM